ncbi:hypothetical protein OG596_24525 [Streptomyces sp. NBC_01102]|uniref:DUF6584 family protein n=1 Tax=Streptomyces sp. NBC_01102 TaxID=2903749 RepID=UPI00386E14A8|nr:hypothetical protein OG596_24525 [Streptomyces sp. NBC_01102]
MTLAGTLARVDADLAVGRIPVARQRLRGLVSSFPREQAPRRRLAAVYRLYGEDAEAGRWMYLEEDRTPQETAAFEERYADPVRRMRALAWRGPETAADSAFAAQQLASLRIAASAALGRSVDWDTHLDPSGGEPGKSSFTESVAKVGCLVLVLAFCSIWVNGLVDLFD